MVKTTYSQLCLVWCVLLYLLINSHIFGLFRFIFTLQFQWILARIERNCDLKERTCIILVTTVIWHYYHSDSHSNRQRWIENQSEHVVSFTMHPLVLTVRKLCDKTAEITVWDAHTCLSATHRQEDGSRSRGVGAWMLSCCQLIFE